VYERLLAPAPSPSPSDGGGEAEATAAEEKDKTLVYIQYMKFKRRTEGLTEARKVFKRARGDRDRVQHHVFVSNALLEYHADKKADVAERIFRFGLDNARPSLAGNAAYALEYLDFLAHLTEDNNTRVLYERVLTTVPREAQREIWARFLRFEADYGDLQAVLAVEARAREMDGGGGAGGGAAVCYAIHRYRYIDLVPVTQQELDYLGYNRCFPSSSSAPAGETPSPAPPAADAQVCMAWHGPGPGREAHALPAGPPHDIMT
jgi:cleavage stimulation factor subunit 3